MCVFLIQGWGERGGVGFRVGGSGLSVRFFRVSGWREGAPKSRRNLLRTIFNQIQQARRKVSKLQSNMRMNGSSVSAY